MKMDYKIGISHSYYYCYSSHILIIHVTLHTYRRSHKEVLFTYAHKLHRKIRRRRSTQAQSIQQPSVINLQYVNKMDCAQFLRRGLRTLFVSKVKSFMYAIPHLLERPNDFMHPATHLYDSKSTTDGLLEDRIISTQAYCRFQASAESQLSFCSW